MDFVKIVSHWKQRMNESFQIFHLNSIEIE